MKKIFRMVIFSASALYITSVWNKGFVLNNDWKNFLLAVAVIVAIYYLINPTAKIILLPINILTLGLASMVVYFFLFRFLINYFSIIEIKAWIFPGLSVNGLTISKIHLSYLVNVCLSALSVSFIINSLESLL